MFAPGVQPDYLPQSVIELIDVVGLNAALNIVEQCGGTRLFVPKKMKKAHWLLTSIGAEQFEKLIAVYQGMEIEIPRCYAAMAALREREIYASAAAGATNSELAREFGYTERGIRKIKRRVEVRDGCERLQQDLF